MIRKADTVGVFQIESRGADGDAAPDEAKDIL
jgi:DNA polymerase III alpha subunit